jgi:transcriptional adapter 2-alpha
MVQRFKVFAKLQTAQDYEVLIEGLLCRSSTIFLEPFADAIDEQNLRKRITELQDYRRMGVTTAQEAEAYETAKAARVSFQ